MERSKDGTPIDAVVDRLREIRADAGQPSFGDIALGVSRVRQSRGASADGARVGRTTVYDAFRTGRTRLDAALVADIVQALGGGEAAADELAARCRAAQSDVPRTPAAAPEPTFEPTREPEDPPARQRQQPTGRAIAAVLTAGLVMNMTGWGVTELLDLPVYVDMLGTAFSAIALGPWWGVLVGVTTNVAGTSVSGPESLLFAPVNAAGALVWGYGVRRWGLGRSVPRFFVLNLLVAAVCTAVAVPIIAGPLGGFSQSGVDQITTSVLGITHSLWLSVAVSNLLSSVTDKLMAGFVALTLIEVLPSSVRGWTPTTWMSGKPEQVVLVRACSGSPEPV